PRRSRRGRRAQVAADVVSADALVATGQRFNHFAADALTDCIGAQIVQLIPLLAGRNSDLLDPGSIAIQTTAALVGSTLIATLPSIFAKLRQELSTGRLSLRDWYH